LPWVDSGRVIVMGQSYGGFGAIGASAHALPGVLATINFAGGGGGDPENRPGDPCDLNQFLSVVREAGQQAKVPMLWLYAENDKYWGADWPRQWHAGYLQGGGRAELKMFPPVAEDGHRLLEKGFRLWRPALDQFIVTLGFAPPRAAGAPEATDFARLDEADKLPFVRTAVKADAYQKFLDADVPRAFAIAANGTWAWRRGGNAVEAVLTRCREQAKRECQLYAVDDAVVWRP
jgi:hypothetical protein